MKILLAHNFYGSTAPSGENTAFSAERRLLESRGHTVLTLTRHSDEIRGRGPARTLKGALGTPFNPWSLVGMRRLLQTEKPAVLHVHNTFPLLSPSIFYAARGLSTTTVLTLHNFRLFCAAAILLRKGLPCTLCLDRRSVLPALRYGCYRGSRAATVPLAAMIALHRGMGTWHREVDAFIALTPFQKDRLLSAGLPWDRVRVKPHFYPDPPDPLPWDLREDRVCFLGRLADHKGVDLLVAAWRRWGAHAPMLDIVGEGPERGALEQAVACRGLGDRVRFLGQVPFGQAQQRLASAKLLMLPSRCVEGFPMVVREAFALGVPVAASRLGSLPQLVQDGRNGVLFAPGSATDMYRVVMAVWSNPERLRAMGLAARSTFKEAYTAETNHHTLMNIYQAAMANRHRKMTAAA